MAEQVEVYQLELDSCAQVFDLIDHAKVGAITEAALAQALLQTSLLDEDQARATAADAVRDDRAIDSQSFYSVLSQVVTDKKAADAHASGKKPGAGSVTLGAALLGITKDLKEFYAEKRDDYRMAAIANALHAQLEAREEAVRKRAIALRQESEHQGVQEAQMMQAMEFNSAWSQNMTEFERQAREIEEVTVRRHQEEFAAFQEKLYLTEAKSLKFSPELLAMRKSAKAHAKMGHYDEAFRLTKKVEQQERWETLKLQNLHKTDFARKELQLRQQQQTQIEALRRRIQRGREEHKEHWLMGAQRLMQSHRNMLSDLKSKQALENLRADTTVKLDMTAHRTDTILDKIRNNYAGTLPRVDTGARKAIGARKALGTTR